jgi:hypothetical protein
VQFASQNTIADERHRHIVFERNYVKANHTSYGSCFTASMSYAAIRNNLFEGVNSIEFAATLGNNTALLPPQDVAFHNNDFYSASTVAHAGIMLRIGSATATGIDVRNNVSYLPGYSGTKRMITFTSGASYTASNNTPDANIGGVSPNFTTTPPLTYADWKPAVGSYAIDAGAIVPVYDDFFGIQRTGTPDMGAVQP